MNEKFIQNTIDVCGDAGRKWLDDLPQIIAEIERNWALKAQKPFQNLSYNYVAPCIRAEGSEAVLKIALPLDDPEIFNEARYLETANGNGTVELFELDEDKRAILLERLSPGENLKEVCRGNEQEAVEIAIPILRALLKTPPENSAFRTLDEWFNNFFVRSPGTNFPAQYQTRARRIYEELSATSKKYLIHGDFHHENILSSTRESFLAIDPKGMVGDVGYEIAVFLNNHLWWLAGGQNLREKLSAAVRRFSEAFGIAPADLQKWAYAQNVLSAWWTFEDHGANWQAQLAFAEFWEV
jgi:streptomycin 6-kinase